VISDTRTVPGQLVAGRARARPVSQAGPAILGYGEQQTRKP